MAGRGRADGAAARTEERSVPLVGWASYDDNPFRTSAYPVQILSLPQSVWSDSTRYCYVRRNRGRGQLEVGRRTAAACPRAAHTLRPHLLSLEPGSESFKDT